MNNVTKIVNGSYLTSADLIIQEGVDEFRLAAAKTAMGIIEQGLAVLKIKQGCEVKQGGTEFPDVAMRLLGLGRGTSQALAAIGENADKLATVVASLPAESVTTMYKIARMDDATITDKIERGVITPTASRANVMEVVRIEKTVPVGDARKEQLDPVVEVFDMTEPEALDALAKLIDIIPAKIIAESQDWTGERFCQSGAIINLSNRLYQALVPMAKPERRAVMKAVNSILEHNQDVFKEMAAQSMPKYNKELQKKLVADRAGVTAEMKALKAEKVKVAAGDISVNELGLKVMFKQDFKRFLGAMHPDKHPGKEEKYAILFNDFKAYADKYGA